jgi:shikimate kinase
MKNIVLTGFMGSGKSAVGRGIAKRLSMSVVDTDELIEERMCVSINDIFAKHGESYFRELERSVVKMVSELENRVIITGGGVVLNKDNMTDLRRNGVIIYLHVTPEVAYERIKDETHRPLLNVDDPLGKIKELMEYRKSFYADNDIEVDTTGLGVHEVVDEVVKRVEPMLSA